METLYKVLGSDGSAYHGGHGFWALPTKSGERWMPGDWMPTIKDELVPCSNGYHLCRREDVINWIGPYLYAVEYRGERVDCDDKVVVREARLLYPISTYSVEMLRLFNCDCAEHVLSIFEKACPNDNRPRNAIECARRFLSGKITVEELDAARAAASDAASAAASDAAWAAARAAAWAAASDAASAAASDAASYAASYAASDAAWDAASHAAWDAEREWQTQRLFVYINREIES
jgi:hypothetical protein